METIQLLGLPLVIVLGIFSQWLAWRLRLPAILLLLISGMLVGPGTAVLVEYKLLPQAILDMVAAGTLPQRLLDPDLLFGGLLLPLVSLFVAIVLFEGGLTLSLSELGKQGRVVMYLVSVGALATWTVATLAAWALLGLEFRLALLLGAILIVTGPTVIGPLLRFVRPTGPVGPILKWEGIVIDPIGVLVTLLVFESIPQEEFQHVTRLVIQGVLTTVIIGTLIGYVAAKLLVWLMSSHRVPDQLHSAVTLAMVVAAFAAANLTQHESGLFSVTIMGVMLANQKKVHVKHILEFKENLTLLLVSCLFIILGARLRLHELKQMDWGVLGFLAVLILVARPAAVLLSTIGSRLNARERLFLMCMAPRGIVAAAVSSVFALRLLQAGYEQAPLFVPYVFSVIIGTVTFYGLTARFAARRLGLANPGKLDVLIAGANPVARAVARALASEKHEVLLVDTNRANLQAARDEGLPIYYASILSDNVLQRVELTGFGRLLALTPNEEVNSLGAVRFARLWGRSEVFQLSPGGGNEAGRLEKVHPELRGRPLFGAGVTFAKMEQWLEQGAVPTRIVLAASQDFRQLLAGYGESAIPLFSVSEGGRVEFFSADRSPNPRPGQAVWLLLKPEAAPKARLGAPVPEDVGVPVTANNQ